MKTLFKIPYECKKMSPAFETVALCVVLTALALWWFQ